MNTEGSSPVSPVERPVLDGLGSVLGLDGRISFDVRNRGRSAVVAILQSGAHPVAAFAHASEANRVGVILVRLYAAAVRPLPE